MLRPTVTQKSVVCSMMALLWIWFLWVYITQPSGAMDGHPHFDVAETQSSPIPDLKPQTKPKPVIDNSASPYDRPDKKKPAKDKPLKADKPSKLDKPGKADKPESIYDKTDSDKPESDKPESVYDKPWTPGTGQSADTADSMDKPVTQEEPGHSREKPSTSFDKPGTAHDGKDSDQDHKPKSPADTDDKSTSTTSKTSTKSGRTLVVYAYSESENSRTNLKFFLKKGLNGAADFVFMLNGETDADALIPDKPNVRIIRRPNTCYDLGGMGEVLQKDDLWKGYSRFITMNSSIRGPFLPIWSNDCWMERYLERVTDQVKLVGMSVNCDPRLHVQSMIFATDKVGMGLLLDPALATSGSQDDPYGKATDPVGLSSCYESRNPAIHAEIGTTGLITAAGYRYDAMATALHSEATIEMFCAANPEIKDLWWDNAYFGGNLHPYETIFFKANRNVDTALVESLTEWHLKMKRSSWDTCGGSN